MFQQKITDSGDPTEMVEENKIFSFFSLTNLVA